MRILLVDDETRLLDSTRRAIRLERPAWAVFTACGGEEAIQVLRDRDIDVLVTDMLMPGMDGAALLRQARQLNPGTVRLILSGHAGRDLIQSCEASFHQFLGKPVDPDAFIRVIESFEIAPEDLKTANARRLVAGLERVPSLPSLYAELTHLLTEPDPSLEAVSLIVQRDLGMASKILKLANSCYISSERKVNDLCQALDLVNLEVLKQAILVHGALEVARDLQPSGLDLAGLWEHSAAVGRAAATLSEAEGQGPQVVSACYSAGLLHDIGRVVLAGESELAYQGCLDLERAEQQPLSLVELEAYGTDHPTVGAELLHLWGLDPALCRAVASHHLADHLPGHLPRPVSSEDFISLAVHMGDIWCSQTLQGNPFSDGLGFDLQSPRDSFQRWTALLDGANPNLLPSPM